MHQLADLVGDMGEAIKTFGGQDFFGRILVVVKLTKRMVFLERKKDRILGAIQRRLQNAQLFLQLDAKERRFKVEEAVLTKIQERLEQKGGSVNIQTSMIKMAEVENPEVDASVEAGVTEAVKEIAYSKKERKEVAVSAGLSEEVFQQGMKTIEIWLDDIKCTVQNEHGQTRLDIRNVVQEEAGQTREEMKGVMKEIKGAVNEINGARSEIRGVAGMAISASDTIQNDMHLLTVAHSSHQEMSANDAATVLVSATAGKFNEVLRFCFTRY
jgi:hypothetical protein